MSNSFTGCDDLRAWLESAKFKIAKSPFVVNDGFNWYAYRATVFPSRECECNDGKSMQIVVHPWRVANASAPNGAWESVDVEVVGEAGGIWYKLQAYSMKHDELMARLPQIEASLIAAWNALHTDKP